MRLSLIGSVLSDFNFFFALNLRSVSRGAIWQAAAKAPLGADAFKLRLKREKTLLSARLASLARTFARRSCRLDNSENLIAEK